MNANDDRELRQHFAALRDEDAASTPPFPRVLRSRTVLAPARRARWIPVAALAAAAVVTAVVLVKAPRGAEPAIEETIAQASSLSSFVAPTDAWLTLSGLEIPSSVPSLSPSSVTLPEASTEATAPGETR